MQDCLTYPCTLIIVGTVAEWCALALVGLLSNGLLPHRPDVEIGVLAPTDAAVIAQYCGSETFGSLPPRLGFASAACATAVATSWDLHDEGAFVV